MTTLGGTYQMNRLRALMSGYGDSVELYNQALNSTGVANSKFNIWQDSSAAKVDKLKATWEGFWQHSLDSGAIGGFIVTGTSLLSMIDGITSKFGAIPTVLGLATAAFVLFNKAAMSFTVGLVPSMIGGIGSLSKFFRVLSFDIKGLGIAGTFAVGSLAGLRVALTSLLVSTGVGIAVVAIATGLTSLVSHISKSNVATREAAKINYDHVNSLNEQSKALKSVSAEYAALQSAEAANSTTNDQKKRLLELQTELVEQYGVSATGIDNEGIAYSNSVPLINARVTALQAEIDAENLLNETKLKSQDTKNAKAIHSAIGDRDEAQKNLKGYQADLALFESLVAKGKKITTDDLKFKQEKFKPQENVPTMSVDAKSLTRIGEALNTEVAKYQTASDAADSVLKTALVTRSNTIRNSANQYIKVLESNGADISDQQKLFTDQIISSIAADNTKDITQQIEAIKSVVDRLKSTDLDKLLSDFEVAKSSGDDTRMNKIRENVLSLVDSFVKGKPFAAEFQETILGWFDTADSSIDKTISLSDAIDALAESTGRVATSFKDSTTDIKSLNQTYSDLSKGQSLSGEAIADLILAYPELTSAITKTADGYTIELTALDDVRKARIQKAKEDLENEKKSTLATLSNTLVRMTAYGKEIGAIQDVEDAKNKINELNNKKAEVNSRKGFGLGNGLNIFEGTSLDIPAYVKTQIEKQNTEADGIKESLGVYINKSKEYEDSIKSLQGLISDPNFGVSSDGTKDKDKDSAAAKDAAKIQSLIESRITSINALSVAQATLNEQTKKEASASSTSGNQASAILLTNTLLSGQRSEVIKLTNANKSLSSERSKIKGFNKSWVDSNGEATESFLSYMNSLGSGTAQESLQKVFDGYSSFTKAILTNKTAIESAYDSMPETLNTVLQYIQAASSEIESVNARKVGLLGSINTTEEKQKLTQYSEEMLSSIKSERAKIWAKVVELRKIIADPKSSPEMKAVAKQSLPGFELASNEANSKAIAQAETLGQQQADVYISSYNDQIQKLENQKSLLSSSDVDKNKSVAIDSEIKNIRLSAQKTFNSQITQLEKKLTTALTAEERMRQQAKLEALQEANQTYGESLVSQFNEEMSIRDSNAQDIVDNYKSMLEQQRDLELDALDNLMEAEDKRHQDKMDNYDDEMNKFQDSIDLIKKSMEKGNATEDFNSQLSTLQKDESAIRKNITSLSMDDSIEAGYKKENLEKDLAAKLQEIEDLQLSRTRDLRSNQLDDLVDTKQKEVDASKDAEDTSYKATKNGLENTKKLLDTHWKSLLENESTFYTLKQNLMSDDATLVDSTLATIQEKYKTFFTYLKTQSSTVGEMFGTINSNLQTDSAKVNNNGLAGGSLTTTPTLSQSDLDKVAKMKANSLRWASAKTEDRDAIFKENQAYGKDIGATYNSKEGAWYKNNIRLYHSGGEVNVPGTSTKKWMDKIMSSNEFASILKGGEVVLDRPMDVIKQLVNRVQSSMANMIPQVSPVSSGSSGQSGNIDINVHIDNLNGDQQGVNKFFGSIKKGLQTGGWK